MQLDKIQRWLDASTFNNEQPSTRSPTDRARKRRRLHSLTPPLSSTQPRRSGNMASPARSDGLPKRPLEDETPRAKRVQTGILARSSQPSLCSSSLNYSSPSSRRSTRSPRKQMRTLQLNPRGLNVRDLFNVADRPSALQKLISDIEAFSDGRGIVARDAEDALRKVAADDWRFAWALGADTLHVTDMPSLVGRTPSAASVRYLMNAAFECYEKQHPETNWNFEVHQRILQMAFRPNEDLAFKSLINFMGCTTASIIYDYGLPTLSKKVDFCIYIEPKNDELLSSLFEDGAELAREAMPEETVNFIDFAPLYDRFIAFSIETKRPSENLEAAQVQLGVWDAARWSFLQRLAGLQASGATGASDADTPEMPDFLPGIIVHGHDWSLVVTTMEGNKTVLWQKLAIGSTSTSRGVYQIVRTLQYLERWAREVHWPWLRAIVENISRADI